ncbi:putative calcium-binding protein CML25 [Acorus gramineus]|uniref:Calcium-binding protein CML25 n=1 Tax=Acorus gramineus TaxID=55184 RepID=A0AAV9BRY6_ACOGR|nr:putative calcium-binding protein CML25 [Acorus gramineus]
MKLSLKPLFSISSSKSKKKQRSDLSRHDPNSSSLDSSVSSAATPKSVLPKKTLSSCSDWSGSGSDEIHVEIAELFRFFDRDGDGLITREELVLGLGQIGRSPPSDEEVELMIAEADRDGDGCISLDEFGVLGPEFLGCAGRPEELREAFEIFDADGDGKISAEELMKVLESVSGGGGEGGFSIDECRRMIGGVDTDGDGLVCFNDFARMMERGIGRFEG